MITEGLPTLIQEAIRHRRMHDVNALCHFNCDYNGEDIDMTFTVNGQVLVEVFDCDVARAQSRFTDKMIEFILHEKEILNDED